MFELQTFGSVDLTNPAGQSVRSVLAQPRRTALLLYLAAASPRGFHRRDTLLALLWPESDTEHGRAALSQAVYFLRRSLSDSVVLSRGNEELGVDPAHLTCDVARFEEAMRAGRKEEALALYRGDFLEGFHISEAPQFERWVDRERGRLREMAVRAAWELAREAEESADAAAAVGWGTRAVAVARHEEDSIRRLIRLLDRYGERARALQLYDDFACQIAEELGSEPSPETFALARSLRNHRTTENVVPPAEAPLPGVQREEAAPSLPAASPDSRERRQEATPRRRERIAMLAGAVGAIVLMTALSMRMGEPAEPVRSRVVVAGLENKTGDPSLDAFGAMAADWITGGLQETGLVEVIDPVTAFVSARNVATDSAGLLGYARAGALARETGAGTVVWGSYYRSRDTLHFSVSISDVSQGIQARRITIEGPVDRQTRLVEELRQRVAGALAGNLDSRIATLSPSTGSPPSLDAYGEYVEGLELFVQGQYMAAYPRLLRAAELDTSFILPRFWALFALRNSGQLERRDSLLRTIAPLRERLSPLDQHSLDYFLADSRGDHVEALSAARHASRLAPQSNWTYMVGKLSLELYRPGESLAALLQLDPERGWAKGWDSYWSIRTLARHYLGQYEEELDDSRSGRSDDPSNLNLIAGQMRALGALGRIEEIRALIDTVLVLPRPPASSPQIAADYVLGIAPRELWVHGNKAAAQELRRWQLARLEALPPDERRTKQNRYGHATLLSLTGRKTESERVLREFLVDYPDDGDAIGLLGALAAQAGNRAEAERRYQQLKRTAEQDPPGFRSHTLVLQAAIATHLGDPERAVRLIREALSRGYSGLPYIHADPILDPLRSYPPFQELLKPRR